ncbi:hypothetical protein BJX65DRAFT_304305 [Aspergillus insuetus]
MRIFVTGSTGFVGTAVVKELLLAGHNVLGLTRSDKGASQLEALGAEPLHGTLQDLETLKQGASQTDAVIHLGFVHDFTNFAESCATDRAAIDALGSALAKAGGDRALVVTSGTMMLAQGKLGKEDDAFEASNPMAAARGPSEAVCLDFAKKGVRASVVRLPPTTHGPGVSGFTGMLTSIALQKGISAYVGEGHNRLCAVHRDDAAKVYRLAVEKGAPGSVFHAVAEEGVQLRDIASGIAKALGIQTVSIPAEEVEGHFGPFQFAALADNTASSVLTRQKLGWAPTDSTVVDDIPVIVDFIKAQSG